MLKFNFILILLFVNCWNMSENNKTYPPPPPRSIWYRSPCGYIKIILHPAPSILEQKMIAKLIVITIFMHVGRASRCHYGIFVNPIQIETTSARQFAYQNNMTYFVGLNWGVLKWVTCLLISSFSYLLSCDYRDTWTHK